MELNQSTQVGDLLREWRHRRRLTQLDLALDAEMSQRHLSFIELGRAKPSREMILRLCEKLDVPLRERNVLLVTAGFAPDFPERSLDDSSLAAAHRAIDSMLLGFEPNPAFVIDRHWTIVKLNKAGRFLLEMVDLSLLEPPMNMLRIALHPKGLAQRILNYTEWRKHILEYLSRQVELTADLFLVELAEELKSFAQPEAAEFFSPASPDTEPTPIAIGLCLKLEMGVASFFVTTTVFGTPIDVTLSELAIETFFPADAETAQILRQIQSSY
ncbi:MAG: helix-turn-helix transcriptional regulator [Cyanobacteria bacterium J06636_16]